MRNVICALVRNVNKISLATSSWLAVDDVWIGLKLDLHDLNFRNEYQLMDTTLNGDKTRRRRRKKFLCILTFYWWQLA